MKVTTVTSVANKEEFLPSWNEGLAKEKIVKFVQTLTDRDSSFFVPERERIATFDLNGTLWIEKPNYIQMEFELQSIYKKALKNPKLQNIQPYKAVFENDKDYLYSMGSKDMMRALFNTHEGENESDYINEIRNYLKSTNHPKFEKPLIELVYLPMIELIEYLRTNAFKVYIVTGGDLGFTRAISEESFKIPPENVIGSFVKYNLTSKNGEARVIRGKILSLNGNEDKPGNIQLFIGRKPILSVGNSDSDIQMFNYTKSNKSKSLCLLLKHDDEKGEYSYNKRAKNVLNLVKKNKWTIISMKRDFKRIFAFEKSE